MNASSIEKALANFTDATTAKKFSALICAKTVLPNRAYELTGRLVLALQEKKKTPTSVLDEPFGADWESGLYEEEQKQIQRLYEEVSKPVVKEGAIQCYRCGHSRTYYYQIQTRSADEGMTTFYSCTDCGHRWKK